MKMLSILLLVGCMQLHATGNSQSISLSFKDTPLQKVLEEIEKQADVRFIYSKSILDAAGSISLHATNITLEKALELCLGSQFAYSRDGKFVVLRVNQRKEEPREIVNEVRGKVENENGQPVAGITVQLKGTNTIAVTDKNGFFHFSNIPAAGVLVVSGAEIVTQEVFINQRSYIEIKISQRIGQLDETIVVGYGKTTQRYNTGSVTRVSGEDIRRQPVSNPLAALQGRVPGLVITNTSGIPGSAVLAQIRGQNSINPDPGNITFTPMDNPLFIIDGVPFAPQNANINQLRSAINPSPAANAIFNNPYGGISPFQSINPSDIESIEVLRDASETAIYGSRGANGVIIITTKKAMQGETKLSVNGSLGASGVANLLPLMDTEQYLQMRREAHLNDGASPGSTPGSSTFSPDLLYFDSTKYTDWKSYFLGASSPSSDIHVSLGGGSANTQFQIGVGYHTEGSVLPGDFGLKRLSANSNFNHQTNDKKLQLNLTTSYSYVSNTLAGSEQVFSAFTLAPNYPDLVNEDGSLVWKYSDIPLDLNPMAYTRQLYLNQTENLLSNLMLRYNITNGLIFRTSMGFSKLVSKENSQIPKATQVPHSNPESFSRFGNNEFRTIVIEPQLDYNRQWGPLNISMVLGGTWQQNKGSSLNVEASRYPNDYLLGTVSGAAITTTTGASSLYRYSGTFTRINLQARKRYLLSFSGRRDGSSRFGSGRQFGTFGSIGVGYIFSETKLFKSRQSIISYGKIRGSYGSTGNDKIGDYQYLSRWAPSYATFDNSPGYMPQNLMNPNFGWSVTHKLEGGLDLGFLKDRLLLSLTFYKNKCGNQLVSYSLPRQTGFNSITANFPAIIQNNGIELSLTAAPIRKKDFSWTTNFNFSSFNNKLLSFPGIENTSYNYSYKVGYSTSVLQLIRYAGVDEQTGLFQFYDKDGAVTLNPDFINDRVISGNLDPKITGGWNNDISWKGISLNFFFQFVRQKGLTYVSQVYALRPGSTLLNLPSALHDHWRNTGDIARFQKLTHRSSGTPAANGVNHFLNSDGHIGDASYLRMKTVSLSYDLPASIIRKMKLQSLRVYVSAQNLFTITSYEGNDPENMSFFSVPPLRTLVAGIQFNL